MLTVVIAPVIFLIRWCLVVWYKKLIVRFEDTTVPYLCPDYKFYHSNLPSIDPDIQAFRLVQKRLWGWSTSEYMPPTDQRLALNLEIKEFLNLTECCPIVVLNFEIFQLFFLFLPRPKSSAIRLVHWYPKFDFFINQHFNKGLSEPFNLPNHDNFLILFDLFAQLGG